MSSREDDKRVAEMLGWTFWEEKRGGHMVHVAYKPGNAPRKDNLRPYAREIGRQITSVEFAFTNCINYDNVPHFTTDPSADYKVLEWVREKYQMGDGRNIHVLSEFQDVLLKALYARADDINREYEYLLMWQPGDYSRALLELDRKGLLK